MSLLGWSICVWLWVAVWELEGGAGSKGEEEHMEVGGHVGAAAPCGQISGM